MSAEIASGSPRFSVGDRVKVKLRHPPGHVRTPFYCRGKTGIVERVVGSFHNPEQLAYSNTDPELLVLYRVRFDQGDLWGEYAGASNDVLELELYEPWLDADHL